MFFLHWWKKNEPPADSTHVGINTPTTVLRLPRAAAAYGGCWHRWCRHHGCKVQLQWHLQCLADKSERRGWSKSQRCQSWLFDVGLLDNRAGFITKASIYLTKATPWKKVVVREPRPSLLPSISAIESMISMVLRLIASRFFHVDTVASLTGEGAKARWLSSTTKRYFTIDFTSQLFFYAQSESHKSVSHPIRFKDLRKIISDIRKLLSLYSKIMCQ